MDTRSAAAAGALPPEALRVRVGASKDEGVFATMGASIAQTVADLAGLSESDPAGRRILDFGCGCGRVLRHLATAFPDAAWHGADVDAEAIAWGSDNLGGLATWHQIDEWPPLPFADESFDVIFAVSVFTHIPPPMQLAWLDELSRVMADHGILIATVYSEFINRLLPERVRGELARTGVVYGDDGGTAGLPESYQSCFHTRRYVVDTWSRRFRIDDYAEHALLSSQDAISLRKR